MTYISKELLSGIPEYVRPYRPELESALAVAIKSLGTDSTVAEATIESVVDAASDKRAAVYEIGSTVLGELAESDHRAMSAIQKMALSEHAHVRHNALLCLTNETARSAALAIMRGALSDKSSRVRCKAADWAGRLKAQALVPDLARAMLAEAHHETRRVMNNELRLLRDGYITQPTEGGGTAVTFDASPGGRITRWVKNELIDQIGIEAVVKRLSATK